MRAVISHSGLDQSNGALVKMQDYVGMFVTNDNDKKTNIFKKLQRNFDESMVRKMTAT